MFNWIVKDLIIFELNIIFNSQFVLFGEIKELWNYISYICWFIKFWNVGLNKKNIVSLGEVKYRKQHIGLYQGM